MSEYRTWCSKDCNYLSCDRNQKGLSKTGQYSFADLEGTFLCEKALNEMEEDNEQK